MLASPPLLPILFLRERRCLDIGVVAAAPASGRFARTTRMGTDRGEAKTFFCQPEIGMTSPALAPRRGDRRPGGGVAGRAAA